MPLETTQVNHLARLARLKLSDSEIDSLTRELAVIVEYFRQIEEVDTDHVDARDQFILTENVFRKDLVRNSLPQNEALANAPDSDGEFFKVPKVIG